MVSEEKLRDMNGDQLRKLNQNGILPLIFAHIFSLSLMSDIFGAQMAMGKVVPVLPVDMVFSQWPDPHPTLGASWPPGCMRRPTNS